MQTDLGIRAEAETTDTTENKVLLLAPTGRDAELAAAMLQKTGIACLVCRWTADFLQRITADCGPLVVAAEALSSTEINELEKRLEGQPIWSDLPLIIFIGSDRMPKKLEKLAGRRNTTLLHRPVQTTTFVTTVRAARQDRLRQFEMRDAVRQLQIRTRQMQRLTLEVCDAEERERNRLSMLLHDELQQLLGGASFHVQLVERHIEDKEEKQRLKKVNDILKQAIEQTRCLSHQLSPPTLRQHGLVASLRWLAERMQDMHHLRITVESDLDHEPSGLAINFFLYRAAQELLFNVVKHARTREARLQISQSKCGIELCVRDNGRGFNIDDLMEQEVSEGLGILSIRERTSYLGGEFRISSRPGHGCTVRLHLPWQVANRRIADRAALVPPGFPVPES